MDRVASEVPVRHAPHLVFETSLKQSWIVANFVAFTIGGALGGGVLRALIEPWFGADVSALEAGRIQAVGSGASAALFWILAGVAQWLVLRRAIRADWWIPVTALGWILAGILMGFGSGGSTSTIGPAAGPLPLPVVLLGFPPLLTLLIGAGQWLILRREADGAAAWLLVNVGALLTAGMVGLAIAKLLPWVAGTNYPSAQALAVVGAVSGPLYGWLTWQFLAQLRRRAA